MKRPISVAPALAATALLVAAVQATATAQILPPPLGDRVTDPLGRGLDSALEPLPEPVRDAAGSARDAASGALDAADDALETAADAADDAVEDVGALAAGVLEPFVRGRDAQRRPAERDVWVVLVPREHANRIPAWALTIRERRELDALDLVLLRITAPDDRDIAQLGAELEADAPGTVVDFNHVYAGVQEAAGQMRRRDAPPSSEPTPQTAAARGDERPPSGERAPRDSVVPPVDAASARALVIGIVDTQVDAAHDALRGAAIVQRDFVPFAGERPQGHGTAVASIVVDAARALGVDADGIGIYAACVFFDDGSRATTATAGSLVGALEWLGGAQVRVVNMSLAGPPNRVLEAALGALAKRGVLVFAAVGNDGPQAAPLYPAAYDSVVGITAVDADDRVYRRANRGPQVAFAAPGVKVAVARSGGGSTRESGTSMAAPYAAAVAASAWRGASTDAAQVLSGLEAAAVDLGERGFDDVFGHGRVAPP